MRWSLKRPAMVGCLLAMTVGSFYCASIEAQLQEEKQERVSGVRFSTTEKTSLKAPKNFGQDTSDLAELKSKEVTLEATSVRRDEVGVVHAEGNVVLVSATEKVTADQIRYDEQNTQIEACGNVYITQQGSEIWGPAVMLRRTEQTGYMVKPNYILKMSGYQNFPSGSGSAEKLVFNGPQSYEFYQATYTICPQPHPDWYVQVSDLSIDKNQNIGRAHHATIYFFDVPILYMPYLDFSLSSKRKSGFLAPSFGSSGRRGLEFALPYYWNIAPNYDATITPRVMTRRGLQVNTQFRYLQPAAQGEVVAEILPNDQSTHQDRHAILWKHQQNLSSWIPNLSTSWNLNKVSDDNYFVDLADRISITSQTILPREGFLGWNAPLAGFQGGVSLRVQRFQTLQDPAAPITPPYERLPQVSTFYQKDDEHGFNWSMAGEYVRFHHPTLLSADRTILNPQVKWRYQTAAFHFIPKIGLHATNYDVKDLGLTRILPITSLDTGFTLERELSWGPRDYLQTLEPRLFYVYIPYRAQDRLPLFDTAATDFNFSQLFLENRFSGPDRINDANYLTAAMVSRLIDSNSGQEELRLALGQRFYFSDQRVSLDNSVQIDRSSDIVAAFSGRLSAKWLLDGGWQFNPSLKRQEKFNLLARYQPSLGRTLNVGYRYDRVSYDQLLGYTEIKQLDVSTQWPLARNWYTVMRWNYSLRDHKIVDSLAGFEYLANCWALRLVAQRFTTTTQTATNAVFVQLELNGLARLGSNPLESLKRNIPGYSKLNEGYSKNDEDSPQATWYEPPR